MQNIEALTPRPSTIVKIALTVVIVSAATMLARTTRATRYYMVDELLESGELSRMTGSKLKVHGWVVSGSIKRAADRWTFVLHKNGKKLRVFSKGPMPDTFKDQSEVIAHGTVERSDSMTALDDVLGITIDDDIDHVIDANEVLAKCPTKYEGNTRTNKSLEYE